MVASVLQPHHWVVATKSTRPESLKYLRSDPLRKKKVYRSQSNEPRLPITQLQQVPAHEMHMQAGKLYCFVSLCAT